MGDTPNQKDDIPNFEIQDEYIVETPTETTGLSITQFQNTEHSETEEIDTELNRKIFYLISLAENIGIHLSDDKFGVGYGESFEDIKKQQDYIDQQTDFYFQKLLKKEKIDKNYIDTHKSAIVHAGILNERDTPCFHNNEVYDAYLSKAQYNTRKSKIKSAQEKEREIVLRNREKKKNNPSIAAQCSFDY